eukprot:TRINITY_DN6280_c0_g1_i1.p2 TRINITY_DN6280_c0_g1~~TRINITY_DN6280_c0_g1_i1.p2  ORF type:complete len:642 (+),score=175.77 TRINITY_DN6280_c0_g1_i1:98-2023(+)
MAGRERRPLVVDVPSYGALGEGPPTVAQAATPSASQLGWRGALLWVGVAVACGSATAVLPFLGVWMEDRGVPLVWIGAAYAGHPLGTAAAEAVYPGAGTRGAGWYERHVYLFAGGYLAAALAALTVAGGALWFVGDAASVVAWAPAVCLLRFVEGVGVSLGQLGAAFHPLTAKADASAAEREAAVPTRELVRGLGHTLAPFICGGLYAGTGGILLPFAAIGVPCLLLAGVLPACVRTTAEEDAAPAARAGGALPPLASSSQRYRCPRTARIVAFLVFLVAFVRASLLPVLPSVLMTRYGIGEAMVAGIVGLNAAVWFGTKQLWIYAGRGETGGRADIFAIITGAGFAAMVLLFLGAVLRQEHPGSVLWVALAYLSATAGASRLSVGAAGILTKTVASSRQARWYRLVPIGVGGAGAVYAGAAVPAMGFPPTVVTNAAALGGCVALAVPLLLCLNPAEGDGDSDGSASNAATWSRATTPTHAFGRSFPSNASFTSQSSAPSSVLKDPLRPRGAPPRPRGSFSGSHGVDAGALQSLASSPRTRERIVKFLDETVPPGQGGADFSPPKASSMLSLSPVPPRRRNLTPPRRREGLSRTPPVPAALPVPDARQRAQTPDAAPVSREAVPRGPAGKLRNVLRRKGAR